MAFGTVCILRKALFDSLQQGRYGLANGGQMFRIPRACYTEARSVLREAGTGTGGKTRYLRGLIFRHARIDPSIDDQWTINGAWRTKDSEKRVAAVEYCTYDLRSGWPQRCIIYLQAGGENGGIGFHKTSITH